MSLAFFALQCLLMFSSIQAMRYSCNQEDVDLKRVCASSTHAVLRTLQKRVLLVSLFVAFFSGQGQVY